MVTLSLTVVLPDTPENEEAAALDELQDVLHREAGELAALDRTLGFGQSAGPPRVFRARFSGTAALVALLRAAGGWMMRHPWATVTFKIESSSGGKTLQMRGYSPVAMARAASDLTGYVDGGATGS